MTAYEELTDLQLSILGVLWECDEATINELEQKLLPTGVTRKTIATLLSRMHRRGYVAQRRDGRASVYRATVSRRRVLIARVTSVLGAMFATNPRAAGARAVDASEVRAGDVAHLRAMLRRAERDLGGRA